jgi:hypothetical protein
MLALSFVAGGVSPLIALAFIAFLVGTAIAPQDFQLAWRRVGNFANGGSTANPGLKSFVVQGLQALKSFLATQGSPVLPDLQVVPFDELSDSEVVIAGAACKLYALVLIKDTATATFSKLTDHATTSSDADADLVISQNAADQLLLVYPSGRAFANGITAQGNTAASTGTGSASNGAKGFAIIGNP